MNNKNNKSTNNILKWIEDRNNDVNVSVKKINFDELNKWKLDDKNKILKHDSGKFFSIEGIRINTDFGDIDYWDQPIINQPEVGILGIIAKNIDGELNFLLQAKIEPGNINYVQLSPTLQATKSNYTQVHEGKTPEFLEYFLDKNKNVVIDQLQSEQGARFLHKRNRNMIIKVEKEIELNEDYRWLTLIQLKNLMLKNNIVNMDTRSVIAGYDIVQNRSSISNRYSKDNGELFSFNELLSWIAEQKTKYELGIKRIPLNTMRDWVITENEIHHIENKYFKVIATDVTIGNREVSHWTQPMVESAQEGLITFIVKRINGVIHFIIQAKVEAGNLDLIELAPTVQCLTGNYHETGEDELAFLEYVLKTDNDAIIIDSLQSEEGGRFFREQSRNMVILADDEFPENLPPNYIWMTYQQIQTFMMFNNYINIQARSLLAAIRRCDEEIN